MARKALAFLALAACGPVACVDDRRMDEFMAMDDSPDTTAGERALAASHASFARGCQARSGETLPYVGTIAAARDLDTIRAALGDRRLHYFGISYGTWLGGAYAHRTPRNLGRAVLDGAVDTGISNRDLDLQQAAAFQRALESFARSCARQSCPLGQEPGAVVSAVRGFLEGLDAHPLRTDDPSRPLTQSLGQTAVLAGLYSEGLWPVLTRATRRAHTRRPNTGDPATPYAWARALTEDIGGKATLLTLKGQGHGAYETGNPCIRKAVNHYLIDGIVPKKGTTCG